jgi:hypothetical protein
MKTKILVEFDVQDVEDEAVAKAAASLAAYHFLTFCTVSDMNTDTDEVEVHVDGYGKCKVRLGEDHE